MKLVRHQEKSGRKVEIFMISSTARHLSNINRIGGFAKSYNITSECLRGKHWKFPFSLERMKKTIKTIKSG